jgi:hypothetical protein
MKIRFVVLEMLLAHRRTEPHSYGPQRDEKCYWRTDGRSHIQTGPRGMRKLLKLSQE